MDVRTGRRLSVACFFLGAACFAFLPWIAFQSEKTYRLAEPYFSNPIPSQSLQVFLRSDKYGKGYFGASRNRGRKHEGIDLKVKIGEPIFAAKSGRVLCAGVDPGYGNYVEIFHPDGFSTRYAHLSQFLVLAGEWVKQGAVIGKSGKTGNANHEQITPHLHFEIRHAGKALDPAAGWMNPSLRFVKN